MQRTQLHYVLGEGNVRYEFKWAQELFWAVLTACAFVLFEMMVTFDPEKVADWGIWAVALAGALVRAAGAAALNVTRRIVTGKETRDNRYPVLHTVCGRIAFVTSAPPNEGEQIEPDEAYDIDGNSVDLHATPTCENCGRELVTARVVSGIWTVTT